MFMIIYGFIITLVSYLIAKPLNKRMPQIPLIVFAMFIVIGFLAVLGIPYEQYMKSVNDVFNHLLGYVTVALAIPLAAMRYDDLPLKSMLGILCFASISAVALPMGLAYLLHMSEPTILAFATRAVTTPIALNIATLLHAPLMMVTLIVILSGVIGAAFSPWILKQTFADSWAIFCQRSREKKYHHFDAMLQRSGKRASPLRGHKKHHGRPTGLRL